MFLTDKIGQPAIINSHRNQGIAILNYIGASLLMLANLDGHYPALGAVGAASLSMTIITLFTDMSFSPSQTSKLRFLMMKYYLYNFVLDGPGKLLRHLELKKLQSEPLKLAQAFVKAAQANGLTQLKSLSDCEALLLVNGTAQ